MSAHRFLPDSVHSLRSLKIWDCCRSGIEREEYERTVRHLWSWEPPALQSLEGRAGSAHTEGAESLGIKSLRKKALILRISYLVTT